jgi:ATP-dependent DNA helicase RecG
MIFGEESETLEFKKTTGEKHEAVEDIAAILNKGGRGELYFGILNNGEVKGQTVSTGSLRDVSQAITDNLKPQIYPTITKVNIDNKDCIRVVFEGDSAPYFAYGRAFIRVADETKQMSPAALEDFFKSKQGQVSTWDSAPSGKAIEDINTNVLRSYMKRANEAGRLDYKFTNRDDVLQRLELLVDGEPCNAAVALFGKKPFIDIQMAIFATDVKHTFLDIDRAKGTIIDLVDKGEQYIRKAMNWRVLRDGSIQRQEIPEVPIEAIREALLNSYAHRDYRVSQTNEIAVFKDRIEIYNPGTFPDGFTPEDYIEGKARAMRRNTLLAMTMYYSKDIENFGTGLKMIADECDVAGVRYEFKRDHVGFTVVFYRPDLSGFVDGSTARSQGLISQGSKGVAATTSDNLGGNLGGNLGDTPQDNLAKLMEYLSTPRSREEMQQFIGLSDRKHFREKILKPLLDSGQVEMTIPDKPNSRNQKYMKVG